MSHRGRDFRRILGVCVYTPAPRGRGHGGGHLASIEVSDLPLRTLSRRIFHHFSVAHCRAFLYFFTQARKSGPARGQSLEAQLLARIVRDLGEPFDQLGLHPLLTILDHVLHLEQGLQEIEKQMHIPTSQTRFCGMRVPYCTLLCSRAGQPVFVAFSAHLETCSNTDKQTQTQKG